MPRESKPMLAVNDIKMLRRALLFYYKESNWLESEKKYEESIITLYHRLGRVYHDKSSK